MKTTLDLPDELLKDAKAAAAQRGESLRELVASAVEKHLGALASPDRRPPAGWRAAFGLFRPNEVASIDRIIARDLEEIVPGDWR